MDSFTYYFDVRFLPTEFDSFFSKQIIDEKCVTNIVEPEVIITKKKKYVPQIIEASTLEFKRTKYNNRNTPTKKRKNRK